MCWHTPVIKKTKQKEYKSIVTLIGLRISLGLFFKVSTLHLNAAVQLFDPFLVKGLLEFGFWNAWFTLSSHRRDFWRDVNETKYARM